MLGEEVIFLRLLTSSQLYFISATVGAGSTGHVSSICSLIGVAGIRMTDAAVSTSEEDHRILTGGLS